MTVETLKDLALTIVVLVGTGALVALFVAFIAFLVRALRVLRTSWKPVPPHPRCPQCGGPLPWQPTLAAASDNGSLIFGFTCPACQKTTSVPSPVKPST